MIVWNKNLKYVESQIDHVNKEWGWKMLSNMINYFTILLFVFFWYFSCAVNNRFESIKMSVFPLGSAVFYIWKYSLFLQSFLQSFLIVILHTRSFMIWIWLPSLPSSLINSSHENYATTIPTYLCLGKVVVLILFHISQSEHTEVSPTCTKLTLGDFWFFEIYPFPWNLTNLSPYAL